MAKKQNIYREVNTTEDVRKINDQIRKEMEGIREREELTELKKRSDYLCTLAKAPAWKEKFGARIDDIFEAAQDEDRKTTQRANEVARRHGWDADYDPWGKGGRRR